MNSFCITVLYYLEQDLECSVDHAHPPAHEGEERDNELNEVVGQGLKAMEPPWGAVHIVGHGVGNWLGLELEGQIMQRTSYSKYLMMLMSETQICYINSFIYEFSLIMCSACSALATCHDNF